MEKLISLQLRFQDKAKKNKVKLLKILIIIAIAISLLVISIIIKNMVSEWYWDKHGQGFYWSDPELFGTIYEGDTWYIEAYVDASWYYEPYLKSFRFENWNPYAGGQGPLNGYAYGPMFVFGLYFISLVISIFYPNMPIDELVPLSVKWTHIAFDSLSVVMVYLIVVMLKSFKQNEFKRHSYGILAASIFACMPINLIYVDSLYLNTPQMTFFTLLSLLLFMKDRYRVGAFILSIAWLTKQMPLFLLIPWFFIVWKKKSLKSAFMDFLLPFLLTTVIISLPWLIMTPRNYLRRVFGPGRPVRVFNVEDALSSTYNGRTVTLAHSFLQLGNEGLAVFYHQINLYMIPFVLFYLIAVMFAYFNGEKIGNNESYQIIFVTWVLINTHLFISRGVYKYYNAFLTPFVVISLLVFFDDVIPKAIGEMPKLKENTLKILKPRDGAKNDLEDGVKSKSNEKIPLLQKMIFPVSLTITFLGSCAAFYYFNWILIVNSRHLHPLYLLILFGIVSVLIHPSIYASLFKKDNYWMIFIDLRYILKEFGLILLSFGNYIRKIVDKFGLILLSFDNYIRKIVDKVQKKFDYIESKIFKYKDSTPKLDGLNIFVANLTHFWERFGLILLSFDNSIHKLTNTVQEKFDYIESKFESSEFSFFLTDIFCAFIVLLAYTILLGVCIGLVLILFDNAIRKLVDKVQEKLDYIESKFERSKD